MSENKTNEEVKELTPEERAVRNDLLDRIEHTINKIRPYIQADGGDVQLIDYEDGVVTVAMLGACAGCMAIDTTLNEGIQALLIEIPVAAVHLRDGIGFYTVSRELAFRVSG